MKGIYFLFSGGYDSAYLINRVLMNLNEPQKKETEINLVSVKATFLGEKNDREEKARKILLNYWKAKYYDVIINYYEMSFDISKFSVNVAKSGLTQPNFWLLALTSNIEYKKYEEIHLAFSYICGDQAASFRNEIETICKMCKNFNCTEWISGGLKMEKPKDPIIDFPIMMECKESVIANLIHDDEFVFDHCTTCEGLREYDDCGECNPCRNLRSCLMNLINDKDSDYHLKSVCQRKLDLINNNIGKVEKINEPNTVKDECIDKAE